MKTLLRVLTVNTIAMVSNATKIKKCKGDDAPFLDDIKIKLGNCTEGQCKLIRGNVYNFEQQFTAIEVADELKSVATAIIFGKKELIRSTSDFEACNSISNAKGKKGACPLKKGESYVYSKQIKIGKDELQGSLDAQWHIIINGNRTIACFEIPIKIV